MRDKHQIIEEPCEVKVSRTVLKTNGVGDNLVEFNKYLKQKFINFENPRIVLCSMQYPEDAVGATIQHFVEQEYDLFIQWLNPGYEDHQKYNDDSGFIPYILEQHNSLLGIRDGRVDRTSRVNEIQSFIRGWSSARGLLNAD